MGLVVAIFCFIIGIPMFLGGLGLTGWGAQDFHEVGKFEGHIDVWNKSRIERNTRLCDAIYSETGTYSDQGHTRDECITERTDDDFSTKLGYLENYREQGAPKVIFGGIIMLFAFLIMWGGNRTRRPKEVRLKREDEG